jgi:hypothetical protein
LEIAQNTLESRPCAGAGGGVHATAGARSAADRNDQACTSARVRTAISHTACSAATGAIGACAAPRAAVAGAGAAAARAGTRLPRAARIRLPAVAAVAAAPARCVSATYCAAAGRGASARARVAARSIPTVTVFGLVRLGIPIASDAGKQRRAEGKA